MEFFSKLFRSRDKPKNYLSTAFTFLFGPTSSGNVVTERTAMQTTAVYACVRVLSEAVADCRLICIHQMAARRKPLTIHCTTCFMMLPIRK